MDYQYVTAMNQNYQTLTLIYSRFHHERELVNIPDPTPAYRSWIFLYSSTNHLPIIKQRLSVR